MDAAARIGSRVTALFVSAALLAGALLTTSAAAAAAPGSLTQLSGADGCLSTSGNAFSCTVGSALKQSSSAAVSPDGRNVYVAASNSGIEVLSRNPGTGAVTQLPGTDGCITTAGTDDAGTADKCGTANGGPSGALFVVVSPNGKNVYFTTGSTILVFSRDGSTGALSQLSGKDGCLGGSSPPSMCSKGSSLISGLKALAVAADGSHLYAVGGGNNNGVVLVFNRDGATGSLTAPTDATLCVTLTGNSDACGVARALREPYGLALSADGKQLYVASSEGDGPTTSDGAVVTLSVQPDGSLVQPSGPAGCLSGSGSGDSSDPKACAMGKPAEDLNGVAVSPDGRSVYGASAGDGDSTTPGAVEILTRDPATGSLTQDVASTAGCLSVDGTDGYHKTAGSCDKARGIAETYRITVSPDSATLYVTSQGVGGTNPGAVSVFSRSSSGALTQLAGADGCISDSAGNDGQGGKTCAAGRALEGAYQLVLSPDCTTAYVAAQEIGSSETDSGALAVFSRQACVARSTQTSAAGPAAPATPPVTAPQVIAPAQVRCVVPALRRKTLAQVRKLLAKSHCRLGKVKRTAGSAQRKGNFHVLSQSISPRSVRVAGTRVSVKLGRTGPVRSRPKPRFTG